ncbi:efflux RND transporter periplasmic adaptor subunit [Tunturibacter empetritectus]|uniref:RND family efflux transporter MFP subunit n=1 Tax=Tunturiibacter empetritectus TaxID=3069691 RepID=A0A7W8MSR7_9BACT|nr:efflux RND transporter periplasmic adaptor subunit [Edaphobacter lichenicola]MBB5318115.1 RND family efflux transporter MFP subunit [Edaphobacter lichenicola]
MTTHALQAEPVSVIHPQSGAPNSDLALPGTLQAYSDSPIYARTNGYVAHWYADIGTHVHQGQLLAVIESPEVDQELSQARASLSQVQANLTLAGITAKRYQDLITTNAVSQQDVDQNNQNLEAQKANLHAADANVSRLQQLQGFERVVAPFDGIITQRGTDIGDLVNAGNGGAAFELFRISKIDTMRIFVPVPETYSEQIANGLKATLELTALPGKQFDGSVVRSSHAIDAGSHTLLTEIDVPNPSGQLMPGAYAEVHLRASAPIPSLIIPSEAVLYQAAGPQVAIVTDKSEIALKKVTLGRDFGDTIEITSGISNSDAVVASPPDYLIDGMHVEVQTPKSGSQN